MSKNIVLVCLTNGFGNNLFQYIYGKLLAFFYNCPLYVKLPYPGYYGLKYLNKLFVDGVQIIQQSSSKVYDKKITISDNNCPVSFFKQKYDNCFFRVEGYFEDFRLFKPYLSIIKKWFVPIPITNKKDLVFHLRLGDRLLHRYNYQEEYKVDIMMYLKAISYFTFKKLYIVTDMPYWDKITLSQLKRMRFHTSIPETVKIDNLQLAVDYMNSLVTGFKKLDPIVRCGRALDADFNFIRSFDNILFQHGTFAWWAACLTAATKVGVYGPWRPFKKQKNKNLSKVVLPGWFSWS